MTSQKKAAKAASKRAWRKGDVRLVYSINGEKMDTVVKLARSAGTLTASADVRIGKAKQGQEEESK